MAERDGFLSRWSRRKVQATQSDSPAAPAPADADPAALPSAELRAGDDQSDAQTKPAPPTLDDVAALHQESDFTRFVAPEVSGDVRNAALKKLFADPHFNVMDGLDTYIEDYNTPDPLPAAMLRKMAQAAYLGLVEPEPASEEVSAQVPLRAASDQEQTPHECAAGNVPAAISHAANPDAAAMKAHDEDPDLRLQSHHDPGPPGAGSGAGGNAQS